MSEREKKRERGEFDGSWYIYEKSVYYNHITRALNNVVVVVVYVLVFSISGCDKSYREREIRENDDEKNPSTILCVYIISLSLSLTHIY